MNTIPPILYGTAWKKERTAHLVALALEHGFRGIDTACQPKHYDEALVGEGCAHFYAQGGERKALFIQTKFTPLNGQDPLKIPYDPQASLEEQILTSCEISKQNLRTDYLNSLLLHSPIFPYQNFVRAWRVFESLVEKKDVHHIGVSNCYDLTLLQNLYRDAHIKPSFVQNRFYPDTSYDKVLRKWADDKGIIYQSFWTLSANLHILSSPILQTLSHYYGKSAEQILYRYVMHKGIVPLNGTTKIEHMKEDLTLFEFTLNPKDIAHIDTLLF